MNFENFFSIPKYFIKIPKIPKVVFFNIFFRNIYASCWTKEKLTENFFLSSLKYLLLLKIKNNLKILCTVYDNIL